MSIVSKKRRLARREAIRAGKPVQDTRISQLMETLDQITQRQIKVEKKKPYLSMTEWLKREFERKEAKKEFRAERRKHKLELQREAEKAQRLKNRELHRVRAEKRAQRLAKEQHG